MNTKSLGSIVSQCHRAVAAPQSEVPTVGPLQRGDYSGSLSPGDTVVTIGYPHPHNLSLVEFMPAIFSHPLLNSADGLTLLQTFTSSPGDPSTVSPLANVGIEFGRG